MGLEISNIDCNLSNINFNETAINIIQKLNGVTLSQKKIEKLSKIIEEDEVDENENKWTEVKGQKKKEK